MNLDKDIFGWLSILVTIGVTAAYLWRMHQGNIRPHVFTWIIWSLTTGISAAARAAANAGAGAWGAWAASLSCLLVVILALRKGHHHIVRSDIIAFIIALCAIPAWIVMDNPLIAVIIVTIIDMTGYYPTFRKCYHNPRHEAVFNYVIANVLHILSLLATESYSLTSVLFPATIFMANSALVFFILWRRAHDGNRKAAAP